MKAWIRRLVAKFARRAGLNGNVDKAIDLILLIRFLKRQWPHLSESARYQLLETIEDRAGNLAAAVKGWRELARDRRLAIAETLEAEGLHCDPDDLRGNT